MFEQRNNDQSLYLSLVTFYSMGLLFLVIVLYGIETLLGKKIGLYPPTNAHTEDVKLQTWN